MNRTAILSLLTLLFLTCQPQQQAYAHGGVVEEDDLCVIKVNYLRGHFKIYQPRIDGHKQYCEDLPNATETVFVMEYLHASLGSAAVDFRIIRDVTGKGRFARWEDIAQIDDLDGATVFYREPTIDPDVLTVIHEFTTEGDFIGIVTANVGGEEKVYTAVFPFEVGYTGMGYWPIIIALVIAIQLQYLVMSGRLARWRKNRSVTKPDVAVMSVLIMSLAPILLMQEVRSDEQQHWESEKGVYSLSFESSLEPIQINQIHTWVLHVTRDGEPVENAQISVEGGMPAHNHGLPTSPRVTADLGDGNYRLEGMRFHMRGGWQVSIQIAVDGKTDTVVVDLTL